MYRSGIFYGGFILKSCNRVMGMIRDVTNDGSDVGKTSNMLR
jgi:hypothetical protein